MHKCQIEQICQHCQLCVIAERLDSSEWFSFIQRYHLQPGARPNPEMYCISTLIWEQNKSHYPEMHSMGIDTRAIEIP